MVLAALPLHRRRLVAVVAAVVGVALIAAGVAVSAYTSKGIPRGATVLGIDLGGLSRVAAAAKLRDGLAGRAEGPVTVRIADREAKVQPADVSLAVDIDKTVEAASHASFQLWGTHTVEPVVTVDAARLDAALRPAAAEVSQAMTVPAVRFEGSRPRPVYPAPGKGIDPQRSAAAVTEGWLRQAVVDVPLVDIDPATSKEDVDKLVADLARPAVAAPVTLTVGKQTVVVPPLAIAKSLRLTGDAEGRITPKVDTGKLRKALGSSLSALETKPQEARIALGGGTPTVVASTGGSVVDDARLAADLLAVLPQPGPRTVTAAMVTTQPKTTTSELAELGIKERVSTFTTSFSGGPQANRSKNIIQAAKEVDGAIVKPGETFSLNRHTGPRGYAEGYFDAPVIVGGKLEPGVGGGVSQFTTTLFNASYYAGMTDVEHKPHSYWFTRYPSVIESTIFWPTLDFKFRNDTPYGVLIDTATTGSTVTVSFWSTKYYDSVTTTWSAKRDITQPKTVKLEPGPKCIATPGSQGFTQDAWRIFRKDGREVKREKFSWTYGAEPKYVC